MGAARAQENASGLGTGYGKTADNDGDHMPELIPQSSISYHAFFLNELSLENLPIQITQNNLLPESTKNRNPVKTLD